jgi:hypothetical protein
MTKKIVRLTEADLVRMVKRIINESFNISEFEFLGETRSSDNDVIEILGKKHRGFQVLVFTTVKSTPDGDVRIVKVMIQLAGGEIINIGQKEFGKDWIAIKGEKDGNLHSLINSAEALGRFRLQWDNAPRLK